MGTHFTSEACSKSISRAEHWSGHQSDHRWPENNMVCWCKIHIRARGIVLATPLFLKPWVDRNQFSTICQQSIFCGWKGRKIKWRKKWNGNCSFATVGDRGKLKLLDGLPNSERLVVCWVKRQALVSFLTSNVVLALPKFFTISLLNVWHSKNMPDARDLVHLFLNYNLTL